MIFFLFFTSCRTNLPKEIMNFPEFPFSSSLSSFPTHWEVSKYLQHYSDKFDLSKFISFRTEVIDVTPHPSPPLADGPHQGKTSEELEHSVFCDDSKVLDAVKWKVTSVNLDTCETTSEFFNAVFICNGYAELPYKFSLYSTKLSMCSLAVLVKVETIVIYAFHMLQVLFSIVRHFSSPDYPSIPGLDLVPRDRIIHSHCYRDPKNYYNQSVLVVGAGQSGRDIALDLSRHCKKVYICNRGDPFVTRVPDNVYEMPGIQEVREDMTINFVDSKSAQVDSIVLATGYRYSFPFLSNGEVVKTEFGGKRVFPLYKHTFNASYPSLVFIGVNMDIIFPMLDFQVKWAISVFLGEKSLPGKDEMIQDTQLVFQSALQHGISPQWAGHYIGSAMFDLIGIWAELGGSKLLPSVYKEVYDDAVYGRLNNILHYKDVRYHFLDDNNWEVQVN